jgi:asparagine synthase (glutamine-hydrolysing)
MANYLNSDHHELVIDGDTVLDSLGEVSYYFDEPFCEGSAFPIYHICRYAKDHVTVILSGEGADEIFCGYETYTARNLAKYYTWIPSPIHKLIHFGAHHLPVSDNKVSLDMKLRRFTDGVLYNPAKAHFWWRCSMNDLEKANILNREFAIQVDRINTAELYETVFNSTSSDDTINRLLLTDCLIHLVDDLLLRADRMSMAHTMELRVPFLDIDLVNFAFSIPSKYKIKGMVNKIPLRNAINGIIPSQISKRTKKGLNMPYQKWFKQKRWRELLNDHLGKDSIESFGIFNSQGIQTMFDNHVKGLQNNAHALWTILNLTMWLRNHR